MRLSKAGKVFIAMAAACAMAFPLAACGGSADSAKQTLSFLSWDNEQVMQPFVDEFEKENPNIKVDFSYAPPTNEYISTLQTRLVGNQAPDVFIITSENKDDLISNGYAKDLSSEPFMKKISQANKDFVSRDGKVYGQSISSWASGIVYNKELLGKVGASEPPATWDEFLALCKKLKAAGIEPFLETLTGMSRIPDSFQGAIFAKDGVDVTSLATKNPQTPGANEEKAVAAWMRLYDEGLADRNSVGVSGDDMKTTFANGQVAMICTGPWDFPAFKDSGLDWGYAQMPAIDSDHEQYAQGSPSPALAIYSKLDGEKLKNAEKFLDFMVSDWALDKRNENGDAITVDGYSSKVTEQYQTVYEKNVQTGKYFLMTNFYSNPDVLSPANDAEAQRLVQGQITPAEWAKNIDDKMASAQ